MAEGTDLYDQDFVAWTKQQAVQIRACLSAQSNLTVDWEHVAEEIEDLGKSQERELDSRLTTIIEHLLKLQHSPAQDPRQGWAVTVVRARIDAEKCMRESPSLRMRLDRLVSQASRDAAKLVGVELELRGELASSRAFAPRDFTTAEVLGDWLPER